MEKKSNNMPQDLKRWLKENGHYITFLKIIRYGSYEVSDLLWKLSNGDYGIKNFLSNSTGPRRNITLKDGRDMDFDDFLKCF